MGDEDTLRYESPGPFRVEHLVSKSPYELSEGHAIRCLPIESEGARGAAIGVHVLDTDPAVDSAGVEAGHALDEDTLRAPDISVGGVPDASDWIRGAPPLAVEYAGRGQDERDLRKKIRELLQSGSRWVWVVRLKTPRCVEVHEAGKRRAIRRVGDILEAPGVLANPVPVEALFDRRTALELTLRNLLQRKGYDGFDDLVRRTLAEGKAEGQAVGLVLAIRRIAAARGEPISPSAGQRLDACVDPSVATRWLDLVATGQSVEEATQG